MTKFATAKAPSRATTSLTLGWGMLAVPVSLYTSTEDTGFKRREFFNADPNIPVGRAPIRKDTDELVANSDVTRMAPATNGTLVAFNDDDIAAALAVENGTATITAFVPSSDVDRYTADGDAYDMRAKRTKGKVDTAAAKAFGLLLAALAARDVTALVEYVARGRAKFGLLDSNGRLTNIVPANGVREAREVDDVNISDAELDMAVSLIDAEGTSTPEIVDDSADKILAAVDARAEGLPTPDAPEKPVVVDMTEALMASIAAAKAAKEAS